MSKNQFIRAKPPNEYLYYKHTLLGVPIDPNHLGGFIHKQIKRLACFYFAFQLIHHTDDGRQKS